MKMAQNTCALCGKTVGKLGLVSIRGNIAGSRFVFDTNSCLTIYRRLESVYGDALISSVLASS